MPPETTITVPARMKVSFLDPPSMEVMLDEIERCFSGEMRQQIFALLRIIVFADPPSFPFAVNGNAADRVLKQLLATHGSLQSTELTKSERESLRTLMVRRDWAKVGVGTPARTGKSK